MVKNHLPSDYAVTESWEWFAEYAGHYALMKISDAAKNLCSEDELTELRDRLRTDTWEQLASDFNNIRSNVEVINELDELYQPGDSNSWQDLAKNYLLADYPDACQE
jgi:hypothetical protein